MSKDLLHDPSHIVFESGGSGYDLVLTNDPYGGVLVIWPATGYLWRWFPGERLATLTTNANPYDRDNIFRWLEETQ